MFGPKQHKTVVDPRTHSIVHPSPIVLLPRNADRDVVQQVVAVPGLFILVDPFMYDHCLELCRQRSGEAPIAVGGDDGLLSRFQYYPDPAPLPPLPAPPSGPDPDDE